MSSRWFQICIAEFVGTFGFVFIGVLSIVIGHAALGGNANLGSIALAHGLALGVFVTACAPVSGGVLNPAVAVALVVAGKHTPARAAANIASQLLGAACAAGLVQLILGPTVANDAAVRLGATIGKLTDQGDVYAVLGLELVATFALMLTVLTTAVDDRAPKLGGMLIGLMVAADILAIGPLTGASMNPARTFGPAICGDHWNMHWAYWAAPVAGACLAALLYRAVWAPRKA